MLPLFIIVSPPLLFSSLLSGTSPPTLVDRRYHSSRIDQEINVLRQEVAHTDAARVSLLPMPRCHSMLTS